MKSKKILITIMCLFAIALTIGAKNNANAMNDISDDIINNGIYIEDIDVSGMTVEEANVAIDNYIAELGSRTITFNIDKNTVPVNAADLGLNCENMDVTTDAVELGKTGNIIQRYKALKDLEKEPKIYNLEISFDNSAIKTVIEEKCAEFDDKPENASIDRVNGSFNITEGNNGVGVDASSSAQTVFNFLNNEWNREDASIDLSVEVVEPEIKSEDLTNITDVLGTFTTSYTSSSASRSENVANGAKLIDGKILMPGETYSTFEAITPFTAENGYHLAGSYLMGKVVDTFGGGICQVSTTFYNAVLLAELEIVERYNHSMTVGYVDISADAAIAESSGKDFKFKNTLDYPIYIESITQNKTITFNIYGKETRPSNRTIEYVSETLSTTEPEGAKYTLDGGLLFGERKQTQSPHVGYKGKLWKHVYVDGVQTEVIEVNTSSYKAEPAYISIGTAWGDEGSVAILAEAVATNDTATVDATIDSLAHIVNQAAVLNQVYAEQQAAIQEQQAAQE